MARRRRSAFSSHALPTGANAVCSVNAGPHERASRLCIAQPAVPRAAASIVFKIQQHLLAQTWQRDALLDRPADVPSGSWNPP